MEVRVSENNPFDDEEAFLDEHVNNALPEDEDRTKNISDREILIDDVIKQIKENFSKKHLTEIMVSFEYQDTEGFSSWVTTHYMVGKL